MRELKQAINQHFDANSLSSFLHDYFPDVYNELTPGMLKSMWITLLIDYASQGRLDDLRQALAHERPYIDWTPLFEQPASPNPIATTSSNKIWYGVGGVLLIGVLILLLIVWNKGNREDGEETAVVPTTNTPQTTDTEPTLQPVVDSDANRDCPPKHPDDGTLDDLPQDRVAAFYPPDDLIWQGNPDYLDPVKRHYYQGEITVGETVKRTILNQYPDKCFVHTYIFNSQRDQIIEIRLDEDGLNGQASILVDSEFGYVTDAQAVDGTSKFEIRADALRYVIRVRNWNFGGGRYELRISAQE